MDKKDQSDFENAKREIQNAYCFKQNGTYYDNFCYSIGCKTGDYPYTVIDLESKSFYGPFTFTFDQNYSSSASPTHATPSLNVLGSLQTEKLNVYGTTLSTVQDGLEISLNGSTLVLKPKSVDEYSSVLAANEMANYNVVATKGDISSINSIVSMNVDQMIAFLEIIKFIPDLSSKITDINNLIDSLENSK